MELKTACSHATVSARVCPELAAELSGPPHTGESGSLLNRRQQRCRRVGDPAASTGRLAHLQKVFADEAADETRGSGENQPAGKRNVTESRHGFRDSDDSVRELWHRKEFWHSFGTVRGQNGWFSRARNLEVLYNECCTSCRGVAQPGSAPALGAGGPEFKSRRPDH